MHNNIRKILASLTVLLGIGHLIFGFTVLKTLGLELFWFQSFGLAMIVTALANFKRDNVWVLRLQNGLALGFVIALLTLSQAPQIWVGLILFSGLFLLSCLKKSQPT